MKKLGLIGYPLGHSFSKKIFEEKFLEESISNYTYNLYPLSSISEFPVLMRENPELIGLNVTIPYKESVIPFLHKLDKTAESTRAVNTILIRDQILTGYNTDIFGFEHSLNSFYHPQPYDKALILGTGGSAKAVAYVLKKKLVPFQFVSRNKYNNASIAYEELNEKNIGDYKLIVNCTPMGMSPNADTFPPLPYNGIGKEHFLFDLVYNPEETLFLIKGKKQFAETKNGLEMLHLQAGRAWEIWNS